MFEITWKNKKQFSALPNLAFLLIAHISSGAAFIIFFATYKLLTSTAFEKS
jgi:hypothetical protein|tara:strand:+ start:637 stop:789 length:153 start_codon:yes stop_codon:yes gene_type:complete